jgi:hypothetical protein
MINQHWARWCFASAASHFQDNVAALDPSFYFYVEGMKRDTRTRGTFCEFRLDGPRITQGPNNCFEIYGEVNILVQATLDESDTQLIQRSVGTVTAAFSDISVYKYGDGPDDDDSFLFCWQLQNNARSRDRVEVAQFGIIAPDLHLTQATVEGHYKVLYQPS